MAGFKLVGGTIEPYTVEGTVASGVAIAEGDALVINGNVLERATSSSTIHTLMGIALETITTAATTIRFQPIVQGQIWEVESKNNTATTQRYESMIFEDHNSIDNTDTDVTGPTGVFLCLAPIGAAADKRLLGELTRLQSTST